MRNHHERWQSLCFALITAIALSAQNDGELDLSFNSGDVGYASGYLAHDDVLGCLIQPDGRILVSQRSPTSADMLYDRALAESVFRLNIDGSLDNSFSTDQGFNDYAHPTSLALQSTGRIIVAGSMMSSFNGAVCHEVVRLTSSGSLDTTFWSAHVDWNQQGYGYLYKAVVDSHDRILIGGYFEELDGSPTEALARLNPDGHVDPSFDAGSFGGYGWVHAIEILEDGSVLAGGEFGESQGEVAWSLIKLDSTGQRDASFHAEFRSITNGNHVPGQVFDIAALPNGRILVSGRFSEVNGEQRNGVVRLLPDGTTDPSFQTGQGFISQWISLAGVLAIDPGPDGTVYCAGDFATYNGEAASGIVRLLPDGSRDPDFAVGAGVNHGYQTAVSDVRRAPDGGVVIAGGILTYNRVRSRGVARILDDGAMDLNFNPATGVDWQINKMAGLPDGNTLIAGAFTKVNGTPRVLIARIAPDGAVDPLFDAGNVLSLAYDNRIHAMSVRPDGRILVGGLISGPGETYAGIRQLMPDGSLDEGFHLPASGGQYVESIVVLPDGRLIVAGRFQEYEGVQSCVVRLLPDGQIDPSFTPEAFFSNDENHEAYVCGVALQQDGRIVLTGRFAAYGNDAAYGIVRLEADGGHDASFGGAGFLSPGQTTVSYSHPVGPIVVDASGRLLVHGWFDHYDGQPSPQLVRLLQDGTLDATFQSGFVGTGMVDAIQVQPDGKYLIAGAGIYAGSEIAGLIRVNEDGGVDASFSTGDGLTGYISRGGINDMLLADGTLLIGGWFVAYDGVGRHNLARLFNGYVSTATGDAGADVDASVFPNPLSSDKLRVGAGLQDWNRLEVSDMCGRNVLNLFRKAPSGGRSDDVDLSVLVSGQYQLRFTSGAVSRVVSLTVAR